jgi:tetratricopeptide (TPR) repeat protein
MQGIMKMISNIQPMGDIKKAGQKEEKKRSSDPIQAEYDDGLKFLQDKDLAQAAIAFHNVLRSYEEKKHQDGIANASNQLGNVCLEKGDFEKAKVHYQRAWDICDRFDDPMSLMALSLQLVVVHRGLNENDKALELCFDMLETYNLNNNPQGTVATMETIADIYLGQGEKTKAADTYRTIASIHSNFNHKSIAEKFNTRAKELDAEAA